MKWTKTMTLNLRDLHPRGKRRSDGKVGRWLIGHGVRFLRGCLEIIRPTATHPLVLLVLPVRWCRVDRNKFLVGDIVGRLAMLIYTPPSGLTLLPLGEVSSSSPMSRVRLIDHIRLPPPLLSPTSLPKWCMWGPIWQIPY